MVFVSSAVTESIEPAGPLTAARTLSEKPGATTAVLTDSAA